MKYNSYYNPEDIKRMKFVAGLIPANSTVLDVGAYDNTFKEMLEKDGHEVTATDIKPRSKDVFRVSITELRDNFKPFNCIVAMEILEHLTDKDLKKGVQQILSMAKDTIIISVPSDEFPLNGEHVRSIDREDLKQMFLRYSSSLWDLSLIHI